MPDAPDYTALANHMLALAGQGTGSFTPGPRGPRPPTRPAQLELYTQELPYGRGEVGGGVTQPLNDSASLFARGSLVPFQGAPLSEADRRIMGGIRFNY